jgi:hypothetical protein
MLPSGREACPCTAGEGISYLSGSRTSAEKKCHFPKSSARCSILQRHKRRCPISTRSTQDSTANMIAPTMRRRSLACSGTPIGAFAKNHSRANATGSRLSRTCAERTTICSSWSTACRLPPYGDHPVARLRRQRMDPGLGFSHLSPRLVIYGAAGTWFVYKLVRLGALKDMLALVRSKKTHGRLRK